jgi:hypothetical protein
MSKTRMGWSKTVLVKSFGTDGTGFVSFRVLSDNTVRVYTYGTWTDYTTDFNLSRPEARAEFKRLMGEGWKVQESDRCAAMWSRTACEVTA